MLIKVHDVAREAESKGVNQGADNARDESVDCTLVEKVEDGNMDDDVGIACKDEAVEVDNDEEADENGP